MKLGVFLRNMGPESTRAILSECAQTAEVLGFESVFVVDHLAIPPAQSEGSGGRYLDPLTTLGFLAAVTKTIRIGVGVLVLPYRPAVLTAKQIATIQELSDERLILGAGVGWMREEFEALGVDPRARGALTDETLTVIHQLFDNDVSAYEGRHVRFPEFVFAPRPARPPIWIGGAGKVAIERTLRFGDSYFPLRNFGPEEARVTMSLLAEGAQKLNRPVPSLVTGGDLAESSQQMLERLNGLREAGVEYYVLGLGRYQSAENFRRRLEGFATSVMAHL